MNETTYCKEKFKGKVVIIKENNFLFKGIERITLIDYGF